MLCSDQRCLAADPSVCKQASPWGSDLGKTARSCRHGLQPIIGCGVAIVHLDYLCEHPPHHLTTYIPEARASSSHADAQAHMLVLPRHAMLNPVCLYRRYWNAPTGGIST